MSFKDHVLHGRRDSVTIKLPDANGELVDVTIYVRAVTLSDFLLNGSRVPSFFRLSDGDAVDDGFTEMEYIRYVCSLGVIAGQWPGESEEPLELASKAGTGEITVEDLEPRGAGDEPRPYGNAQLIFAKIAEISDLGSIQRFLQGRVEQAGDSGEAGAVGAGGGQSGEEVQDGPVDGADGVESGPV